MSLNERMIDPKSRDRRPRRAAYALPTFFTAGNIFLGYLSVIHSFQGAMLASGRGVGAEPNFEVAAKCIGMAEFVNGLEGRIEPRPYPPIATEWWLKRAAHSR